MFRKSYFETLRNSIIIVFPFYHIQEITLNYRVFFKVFAEKIVSMNFNSSSTKKIKNIFCTIISKWNLRFILRICNLSFLHCISLNGGGFRLSLPVIKSQALPALAYAVDKFGIGGFFSRWKSKTIVDVLVLIVNLLTISKLLPILHY